MSKFPILSNKDVVNYYHTKGSKYGYKFVLGGTKHFGYYESKDSPWNFNKALRKMEDLLFDNLDLNKNDRLLDAGCGVGDVACYLANKFSGQITGVDLLDFNIKEAQKRAKMKGLSDKLTFICGDYTELGFKDASFDAIYTMETLVHVPEVEKALKNFYRLLKPGGKLVMFEYSHAGKDQMSSSAFESITKVNTLAAMPSFQKFEHGVLEKLLKLEKFTSIKSTDISKNVLPMLKSFSIMAYIPYKLINIIKPSHRLANITSAVEFYKHRQYIHYNVISARKVK